MKTLAYFMVYFVSVMTFISIMILIFKDRIDKPEIYDER